MRIIRIGETEAISDNSPVLGALIIVAAIKQTAQC